MWRGDSILKEGTRENKMRMKICNLGNGRLWFITHQETEGFDLYRMEYVMRKNPETERIFWGKDVLLLW